SRVHGTPRVPTRGRRCCPWRIHTGGGCPRAWSATRLRTHFGTGPPNRTSVAADHRPIAISPPALRDGLCRHRGRSDRRPGVTQTIPQQRASPGTSSRPAETIAADLAVRARTSPHHRASSVHEPGFAALVP